MDVVTLKKAVKDAGKYTPSNPVPDEWEPTKVAEALDILAGSRIVEQGSNENGHYVLLSGGMAICIPSGFLTLTYADPALLIYTWTFPVAFANTGAMVISNVSLPKADARGVSYPHVTSITATSALVRLYVINQLWVEGDTVQARPIAIGRWK